jgi:hypothetical protein
MGMFGQHPLRHKSGVVFAMSQKAISADDTAAVLSVQFMRASVRFVASVLALIGVSLLLASF